MSSIIKTPSFTTDISSDSIEESGWTTYFEDFFNNQNDNMSLSGVSSSSSLVSNATSLPAKNIGDNEQAQEFSLNKITSKRPSFNKRKNFMTVLVDDALEDTATFPLSSPKEKGNIKEQREEKKEWSFNGREIVTAQN
ncbi:PREDICTED: uncharacterized protein LOC109354143 [Lupinus angustifolius]|uniref:uncharacterized protein LOC109354143 n=1 Tax=Lupinus angustifolius TaxID=3871 RepID=UPI00092EB48B|nr:PREDICTED: uncharacterized protein LOC109354143 [Lupinus angustifolius]